LEAHWMCPSVVRLLEPEAVICEESVPLAVTP
jgi:hypothetical protein